MCKFRYPVFAEFAADFGMFANPTTGSEAVSYPFPSRSACIGVLESVCRVVGVEIEPVAIGICFKPRWVRYTYNSRNVMRKPDNLKRGEPCQLHERVLESPCYQILALAQRNDRPLHPRWQNNTNPAHAFQCLFLRRLRQGKNYHAPSMGRKEFLCTYVGPIRTPIMRGYSAVIPSMASCRFVHPHCFKPFYEQNVTVKEGVVEWIPDLVTVTEQGFLAFKEHVENVPC